jgi:hypothetical protein
VVFIPPPLSNSGSFASSVDAAVGGAQGSITIYPNTPQAVGMIVQIAITSQDASVPQVSVSDDDASTWTLTAGDPATLVRYTATMAFAHAGAPQDWNRIFVVFPNAIHKASTPNVTVSFYRPVGQ